MKAQRAAVLLASLGVLLVPAGRGLARDSNNTDAETRKTAYSGIIGARMVDPSLTSAVSPPGLAVLLTTDRKDRRAAAKIGLRLGDDFFADLRFSVPFGDPQDEAEPITLDGLARSAAVDLGIHYLAWNPKLDVDEAKAIRDEFLVRNPRVKNFVLSLNGLKGEPDLRRRLLAAIRWRAAFFAALRTKVGRQDFTYSDRSFRSFSAQKTNASLEAAAGALFPELGYIGFSWEIQRFYEAGEAADLILPFQGGPVQQVKRVVMGPPARRTRNRLQVEYRSPILPWLAVNPRASYFPKENIVLLELPVYFFRSPEEGLNGGVDILWTSKGQGRFGLALFIGSAFSLTPD